MELYLDKTVESIPVVQKLKSIIDGIAGSDKLNSNLKSISDISSVQQLYDPVRDFVDYYVLNSDSSDQFPEGRKQYIVNALYASKGGRMVFETFQEVFELKLNYSYNFPIIKLIEFDQLKLSNIITFINKFKNMLYYLLYFTEINITIKNYILSLTGYLNENIEYKVIGYDYYDLTNSQEVDL